jgi:DNA-binding CsgD family transcriptional regulator
MTDRMLVPWFELAYDVFTSCATSVPWNAVAATLREQLASPLAGTFTWSPDSLGEVVGYPSPKAYDLAEIAGRAPRGHPLALHYSGTTDRRPRSINEVPAVRTACDDYVSELEHHGIEKQLWIPIPHPTAARVVGVCRPVDSYTAHEKESAGVAQPILVGLVLHAEAMSSWRGYWRYDTADCGLSPREVAVLCQAARGRTTAATARTLGMSPRTAEKHLENTYRKLGVRDRVSAILRAQQVGLIPGVTTDSAT